MLPRSTCSVLTAKPLNPFFDVNSSPVTGIAIDSSLSPHSPRDGVIDSHSDVIDSSISPYSLPSGVIDSPISPSSHYGGAADLSVIVDDVKARLTPQNQELIFHRLSTIIGELIVTKR